MVSKMFFGKFFLIFSIMIFVTGCSGNRVVKQDCCDISSQQVVALEKSSTNRPEWADKVSSIEDNNGLHFVGGVMGGSETEVDNSTKNILIEVGTFDMYSIRRASMAHGLFTDAVTRFNKGQSPLQNERILNYAAQMICDVTKGVIAGETHDKTAKLPQQATVKVSPQFISDRLGVAVPKNRIANILANVEFDIAGNLLTPIIE